MSKSVGLSPTQYVAGGGGGAGSLALVSNTFIAKGTTFAPISLSVNVTTEGLYDWLVNRAIFAGADLNYSSQYWKFKRSRGLLLPGSGGGGLSWFGPTEISPSGLGQGPIAFSANAGDDASVFVDANATFPMTNLRSAPGLFQNNTATVPTGYGWRLNIPISTALRTVNIYPAVRCQLSKTITATITAHLMDGSAGDVATTITSSDPGNVGAEFSFYKVVFTAKGGGPTNLVITGIITATTGITTVAGDANLLQGVTIS